MMPAVFGFGAIASAWSKILSAFVGDLERRRHDAISDPSARQ
jgi:hypothetical protein